MYERYFDLKGHGRCGVRSITRLGDVEIYDLISPKNDVLYLMKNNGSLTLYTTSK